jgi:hypothetical protein
MAAPLENCTREDQRSVIRFLWPEGVKPREIHRRMIHQYGGSCMNEKKVYQAINRMATHILSCQEKKSAPSVGKLMLTLLWHMNGTVLEHCQEKGKTVNNVRYSTAPCWKRD